jgi:hypothetical protein
MKISKMNPKATYLECPDYKCKRWYDNTTKCEYDCPQKEKLEKLIKCWKCGELIRLPIQHSMMERLNHICSDDSRPFILESGIVITLREKLEK